MSGALQNQFRQLFENDYPGIEAIREKIITPLWKDCNFPNRKIDLDKHDKSKIKDITIFANQNSDINFVDVELSDSVVLKHNRVTINRYISKAILDAYQSTLIFFHYKDNSKEWRISYAYKGANNKDCTNPKRYTYLCGKDTHCRTAAERFAELEKSGGYPDSDAMMKAFSVESLTKEFFNQLFKWYDTWACKVSKFPGKNCIGAKAELTTENNQIQLIRLITRLMFVWFIKQKDLVPSWIFDREELHDILSDCDLDSDKKGNYYNAVLQNLFFGALNKKIQDREFAEKSIDGVPNEQYGIKSYFRDDNKVSFFNLSHEEMKKHFEGVPFLNGGLFECLDWDEPIKNNTSHKVHYVDGFSRNANRRAFVPNALFWSENEESLGIINILGRYNFTVEESSANDVQVALDPELLGKIFENLLGTYNPETKESARKESGSFYTPREIVSYMVNRSLISYLQEKVPSLSEEQIENLVDEAGNAEIKLNEKQIKAVRDALYAIKIIDPACGSGAFPMGILNKLVELHSALNRMQGIDEENLYELKTQIIERSIFGVDIQPIAVQICKLRFFISLICEQPKTGSIENNYGYNPLPNLETKFVAANTLIGLDKDEKEYLNYTDENITKLKNDLINVRKEHFNAKTSAEKKANREADEKLRLQIINYLKKNSVEINLIRVNELKKQEAFLKTQIDNLPVCMIEKNKGGKDLFGNTDTEQYDKNETARKQIQTALKKIQKELSAETNKANKTKAIENLEKLIDWNPYDQSADASNYFDPDWMFGVKDGFDVVIGNPPYIDSETMTRVMPEQRNTYSSIYETAKGNWDIYILFFEFALKHSQIGGTTAFIVPNKIVSIDYAETVRDYISKNAYFISLRDYSRVPVFEASVYPCTLIFSKAKTDFVSIAKMNDIDEILYDNRISNELFFSQNNWNIWLGTPNEVSLLTKLIEKSIFTIKDKYNVSAAATVNEAYIVKELLKDGVYNSKKFKLINSGTIDKYVSLWGIKDTKYIKASYSTPVVEKSEIKKKLPNRYDLSTSEKLIIASMTKVLEVYYDNGEYFAGKSTTCIYQKESDFGLKFILGCLNSKLESFWLIKKYNSQAMSGEAINISTSVVQNLPIPPATPKQQKPIIDLVDKILVAKKTDSTVNTSKLEAEIDRLVYELYGLSEDEIKVVEGR